MTNNNLDTKDLRILDLLQENGKYSSYHIAKKTGFPVTTIYHRIRELEKQGIIRGYTVILDKKKMGLALTAYMLAHYDIALSGKEPEKKMLDKQLRGLSGVEEIKYLTGRFDLLLKLRVRDLEALNTLLASVRKIIGVGRTETFLVLEEVK